MWVLIRVSEVRSDEISYSLQEIENGVRFFYPQTDDPSRELLVDEESFLAGDRMGPDQRVNRLDRFPFNDSAPVTGSTVFCLRNTRVEHRQRLQVFAEGW
jgi:hypothetical protein